MWLLIAVMGFLGFLFGMVLDHRPYIRGWLLTSDPTLQGPLYSTDLLSAHTLTSAPLLCLSKLLNTLSVLQNFKILSEQYFGTCVFYLMINQF